MSGKESATKNGAGPARAGKLARPSHVGLRSAVVLLTIVVVLLLLSPAGAAAQGSVVRVGNTITVPAGERVVGNLTAIGGAIDIFGDVEGDVVAIGGLISIDGHVRGDVAAIGGGVRLGPNARVSGDVSAIGGTVARDPLAVVEGEISSVSFADGFRFDLSGFPFVGWRWFDLPWLLLYVGGLFALALMVAVLIPDQVEAVARAMETNAGRSIAIGLVAVLLLLPLTLVLVLTIVGPFLLWLGFLAAKALGYAALVSLVGRRVAERLAGPASPVGQLAVGVAVVALIRYIPVLGALFSFVVTLWSLGAVLDTKFGTNRPWMPPRQPLG